MCLKMTVTPIGRICVKLFMAQIKTERKRIQLLLPFGRDYFSRFIVSPLYETIWQIVISSQQTVRRRMKIINLFRGSQFTPKFKGCGPQKSAIRMICNTFTFKISIFIIILLDKTIIIMELIILVKTFL